MNDFSLPAYLWVAFAPLVGAFLGAYFKRRAEDIATNANFQNVLEQLKRQTAETENIKAAISDDVWDRQKQWELKRDAVYGAWRALRELETALIDFRSAHLCQIPNDNEDVKNHVLNMRQDKAAQFYACFTKFNHAKELADLVVGEKLTRYFSAYFQKVGPIAKEIAKGNAGFFTSEKTKELADISNEIRQEARKELNIKNTDRVDADH